jgi:hypothetical protein
MIEEIVPYEESLALSQIGFVQSCWHAYHDLTWPSKEDKHKLETFHSLTSYMSSHAHQYINPVLAPTYSQAFRWFRNMHNLEGSAEKSNDFEWYKFNIYSYLPNSKKLIYWDIEMETYEEAELACLRNLIKLVNETNNERNSK